VTLPSDPRTGDDGFNSARGPACVLHPSSGRCPSTINKLRFLDVFLTEREQNKDDLAYHMTAHLRLNAVYWGLTALCVMNRRDALDREEMIDFVVSCWDEEAGYTFNVSMTSPALIDALPSRRIRKSPRP